MSKILDYNFAALASAHLGKHVIHRIADEASGAVAAGPPELWLTREARATVRTAASNRAVIIAY